jgi:hypothetical protein
VAGLLPGTEVTFRPSTGSASHTGEYFVGTTSDIDLSSGGFRSSMQNEESGKMVLDVNFASGAVDGRSGDGRLTNDGDLGGRDLSGAVTYRGVTGQLGSLVGGDQAFGAFHGNDADLIYAGGFIADRAN